MAKMNQNLYGAVGKIGNITVYQSNGETLAREIVRPKNPKTFLQTMQRILLKAAGVAYGKFKEICDHSFEGFGNGSECMNNFKKVNINYLRDRAAAIQGSGQSLDQFYQFTPINGTAWAPFAVIVSQGHLPTVSVTIDAEDGHVARVNSPSASYADFVNAWGIRRNDQITFVTVQKVDGKYEVELARIVLNPRNPDGSGAPMTTEIVNSEGGFPCSNWKNDLNFSTFEFDTDHFNFVLGRGGIVVAAGIIVSRKNKGAGRKDKSTDWFRSNCQLVLNEAGFGDDLCSLAKAIETSYVSTEIDIESEYYLNNAGGGGTGSTGESTPSGGSGGVTPGEPTYNTLATINGVSQSIAGGNVTATAPVTTVAISGNNLGEVVFTAKVDGTGDAINPTTHDASSAAFTGLNVQAGHSLVVYRGGTTWFTITAQAPDEGGDAN